MRLLPAVDGVSQGTASSHLPQILPADQNLDNPTEAMSIFSGGENLLRPLLQDSYTFGGVSVSSGLLGDSVLCSPAAMGTVVALELAWAAHGCTLGASKHHTQLRQYGRNQRNIATSFVDVPLRLSIKL